MKMHYKRLCAKEYIYKEYALQEKMAEKCILCNEKIEETFMGKLKGTLVKIKKGEKNQSYYVCSSCQKKFPSTVEEVMKKLG